MVLGRDGEPSQLVGCVRNRRGEHQRLKAARRSFSRVELLRQGDDDARTNGAILVAQQACLVGHAEHMFEVRLLQGKGGLAGRFPGVPDEPRKLRRICVVDGHREGTGSILAWAIQMRSAGISLQMSSATPTLT